MHFVAPCLFFFREYVRWSPFHLSPTRQRHLSQSLFSFFLDQSLFFVPALFLAGLFPPAFLGTLLCLCCCLLSWL